MAGEQSRVDRADLAGAWAMLGETEACGLRWCGLRSCGRAVGRAVLGHSRTGLCPPDPRRSGGLPGAR